MASDESNEPAIGTTLTWAERDAQEEYLHVCEVWEQYDSGETDRGGDIKFRWAIKPGEGRRRCRLETNIVVNRFEKEFLQNTNLLEGKFILILEDDLEITETGNQIRNIGLAEGQGDGLHYEVALIQGFPEDNEIGELGHQEALLKVIKKPTVQGQDL